MHEIGRDPFRQQGEDFSRHIELEWGKIPTWWEKFLLGNGTWSEKFRNGQKKRQGRVHEGIINQAIKT
jgi:hypothetical protein